MDLTMIADELAKEANVIISAPWLFVAALLIAIVIMWRVLKAIKSAEINGLQAQIGAQKDRIEFFKEKFGESEKAEGRLQKLVADLQRQVDELKANPTDKKAIKAISDTSASVFHIMNDLATSNTDIRDAFEGVYVNRGGAFISVAPHPDRLKPQFPPKNKRGQPPRQP